MTTRRAVLATAALAALAAAAPTVAAQQKTRLLTEEFMVPARDPGIELYVRNKRPANVARFTAERTLLFVHGATYPSETAFDLPLDGQSWMDYIAARGFNVYLMDLRGYGKSTRPKELDEAADKNPPLVRGDTAVKDIGAVVDWILAGRKLGKINLLGWSWGTVTMATYATENPDKVNRLVLYAPVWIRSTPSPVQGVGAYRVVKKEAAYARWINGVPEGKKETLIPKGWFEAWADATFKSDPGALAQYGPDTLRAPNGVIQDSQETWAAGKAYYDAAKITVPTLLTVAEWDRDTPTYMAQNLFPLLVNAPMKRLVILGEGTHTILMEKNRMQLFEAVQHFLEEPLRLSEKK